MKILIPLAEAGDAHAIEILAALGNVGSSCDVLKPSPNFANARARMLERARQHGATIETQQRLDDMLAEEQQGPTGDELEACRQSAAEFHKIELDRKSPKTDDAEAQLEAANELLDKGTPESQREAMQLLRAAARTSLPAKTELARCLLKGCPTPEPDPAEARQLLTDAALGGDWSALSMLAASTDPNFADVDPTLPASERYAWSRFRERLSQDGCFGSMLYEIWAMGSPPPPNLLAMSPADSATAEARTAQLIATQLNATEKALGCD